MPRFIVPPKYTYAETSGKLVMPFSNGSTPYDLWLKNGMVPWLAASQWFSKPVIFSPAPALPTKGADTNQRSHSKITVTSVRWKFSIQLNMELINSGSCLTTAWLNNINAAFSGAGGAIFPYALDGQYVSEEWVPFKRPIQWPPNPGQFLKFRYMMVEFDEDIAIDDMKILSWFYSTYCHYRSPEEGFEEKYPLPSQSPNTTNLRPGPISVHSNVMRMTTPWTGKFKILADRMFILTANRPRLNIDITVPINRVYTFADDWQYSSTLPENTLLSPHIYCFVLPPLSYEQDFGPYDAHAWYVAMHQSSTGQAVYAPENTTQPFVTYTSWMKLHFVDI